jgi:citrate lyase beta subunit
MTHPMALGASLYVPATRSDLVAIGNREKYPILRSVIFCTEDSVHLRDLPRALDNLAAALSRFEDTGLLRFVRVRDPDVLRQLLAMPGVEQLDGFVFPKITERNLEDYFSRFAEDDPFQVMLTLETVETFDLTAMASLRNRILQPRYRQRILALRIGGNDLLNLLALRRPRDQPIYHTPLRTTINQLVTIFRPHGLHLTGPVFEYLDRGTVLRQEVRLDLSHGLFGKSAIHPAQVPVIEEGYRVRAVDLRAAEQILSHSAPSVFRLDGAMCEPATHRAWAEMICQRAKIYGVIRRSRRHRVPDGVLGKG